MCANTQRYPTLPITSPCTSYAPTWSSSSALWAILLTILPSCRKTSPLTTARRGVLPHDPPLPAAAPIPVQPTALLALKRRGESAHANRRADPRGRVAPQLLLTAESTAARDATPSHP